MLHERNLGVALLVFGLATSACVTALPAQRPNDTFVTEDGPVVGASEDEQAFINDINKELVKQGWQPAIPGQNEMNAAKIGARAVYEYRWSSSGVKSSPTDATSEKPLHAWVPTTPRLVPTNQYAVAYGIVPDFDEEHYLADYPARQVTGSDLEDLVRKLRPIGFQGQARLGVSVLPDPADAHRIFAAVMRDELINITKGAPRVATPGSSFTLEGKLVAADRKPNLWVLRPDGKIDESPATIGEGGIVSATYTLPAAPGIYIVALSRVGYQVPVFSGVEPTPWPPRPPDDAPPVGDAKDAATRVVQALEDWRVRHGLPLLPVRADFCATAKSEAAAMGAAEAKAHGGPPDYKSLGSQADRLRAAGIDPSRTSVSNLRWRDDRFIYALAKFPEDPVSVSRLASPNAEALGVGVTYFPKESVDDPTYYRMVWIVSTTATPDVPPAAEPAPTTPEPPKVEKVEPSTHNEEKASQVGHTSEEAPIVVPAPEPAAPTK